MFSLKKVGALVLVASLAACGSDDDATVPDINPNEGGGGGSGSGGGTAVALTDINNDQASAASAVATVNAGVADIVAADAAGALPGGSRIVSLPGGATTSGSIECSSLGTSGSGSLSYTFVSDDSTFAPVRYEYSYNNCSWSGSGVSVTYNGTGSLVYDRYASANDYQFTWTYDLDYSYNYSGYSDSGSIDAKQTCSVQGTVFDCSYLFGNNRVRDVNVATSGSLTTVTSARISNDYIDCVYDGWTYDNATGRATAGTVTVTDSGGDRLVITANANGYVVQITAGGQTSTYSVSFS